MKKAFWTADWFFGLVFALLFAVLAFVVPADSFARLETAAYDLGMRASNASSDANPVVEAEAALPLPAELVRDLVTLRQRMDGASEVLNTDARLADSLQRTGNVVLPFTLNQPFPIGRPDSKLPERLLENTIMNVTGSAGLPSSMVDCSRPPKHWQRQRAAWVI